MAIFCKSPNLASDLIDLLENENSADFISQFKVDAHGVVAGHIVTAGIFLLFSNST